MASLIHSFIVSDTVELAFLISWLNGKLYGDIRQYCHSSRYTGPTKHGLFLRRSQLGEILEIFIQNKDLILDAKAEERIGIIPYKNTSSAIISLVESTLDDNPVCIDVREYVESPKYTGFTKKGFRLPVNLIDELIEGLRLIIEHMDQKEKLLPFV